MINESIKKKKKKQTVSAKVNCQEGNSPDWLLKFKNITN